MNRRDTAKALGILTGYFFMPKMAFSQSTKGWQRIEVGSWTFELPKDWAPKKNEVPVPYFETSDQSKGCYLKAIQFSNSKDPAERSIELRTSFKQSFQRNPKAKWKVVREETTPKGRLLLSVTEIFDQAAKYRIVSTMLVRPNEAVELNLHDYACEDYAVSVKYFSPIAESLRARET